MSSDDKNQINKAQELSEKPNSKKIEKFKKNFSKTLAASLAILNLFSGNFNLAKVIGASTKDGVANNIGDNKKKSNATNKKCLRSNKNTNRKEIKINQKPIVKNGNFFTKANIGVGIFSFLSCLVSYELFQKILGSEKKNEKTLPNRVEVPANFSVVDSSQSTNTGTNSSNSVLDNLLDAEPSNLEEISRCWLDGCAQKCIDICSNAGRISEAQRNFLIDGFNLAIWCLRKLAEGNGEFEFVTNSCSNVTKITKSDRFVVFKNLQNNFNLKSIVIARSVTGFSLKEFLGDKCKIFKLTQNLISCLGKTCEIDLIKNINIYSKNVQIRNEFSEFNAGSYDVFCILSHKDIFVNYFRNFKSTLERAPRNGNEFNLEGKVRNCFNS